MNPVALSIAFGSAFLAGAINAVAGGGTLVTFPALLYLGLPAVAANATNSVAITPGFLGSLWGYRRELADSDRRYFLLVIPSLLGGLVGAVLLRLTPPSVFATLVPYLVLFATLLFIAQQWLQQHSQPPPAGQSTGSARWLLGAFAFQFFVALYGGYFGAGAGILMLATLGILGLRDIHHMNAWKTLFSFCINGIAAIYFVWAHMVAWPFVVTMAAGAIVGGYGGAGLARQLGRTAVRRIVIAIGFTVTILQFFKH